MDPVDDLAEKFEALEHKLEAAEQLESPAPQDLYHGGYRLCDAHWRRNRIHGDIRGDEGDRQCDEAAGV
jgi:hypothetical protein